LPAEAEDRERTVAEMKKALVENARRIKELERDVKMPTTSLHSPAKVVEKPALTDADRALIQKLATEIAERTRLIQVRFDSMSQGTAAIIRAELERYDTSLSGELLDAIAALEKGLDRVGVKKLLEKLNGLAVTPAPQPIPRKQVLPNGARWADRPAPRPAPSYKPHAPSSNGSGHLPPGEHAVLTAALTYPDGLDRKRLSVLTGYKRSSRDAYIARLQTKSLITVNGQSIVATEDGRAALPDFEPLPSGQELVDYWRARLPEGERKTLDVLLEVGSDTPRDAIDESTGYKRSSRDAYLTRLKARGIVEFVGRGMVRASAELLEG
jgi:hypothetical protein